MEQLDLIKITPDGKRMQEEKNKAASAANTKAKEDDFFEMLSRSQSKRMDDQRCSIKINSAGGVVSANAGVGAATGATRKPLVQQNSLFVDPTNLPGLKSPSSAMPPSIGHPPLARSATTTQQPDDAFLDMLMRCQGSRLEEQRSELPRPNVTMDAEAPQMQAPEAVAAAGGAGGGRGQSGRGTTVPDEDFFSLIMKVQSGRMEDQRASIPFGGFRNARNNNNNNNAGRGGGGGAAGSGSGASK